MKEVFIISENEEIFLMISNSLSYLPVHFSWVGNMDNAENQFISEKPDLVFFLRLKNSLYYITGLPALNHSSLKYHLFVLSLKLAGINENYFGWQVHRK